MTLDAMRAHIDRLIANLRVTRFHFADDLDIRWIDDREEAMAITDADPVEIHLPNIRSTLDYATCLHELGHVNGRYQGSASSKTPRALGMAIRARACAGVDRGNGRGRTGVDVAPLSRRAVRATVTAKCERRALAVQSVSACLAVVSNDAATERSRPDLPRYGGIRVCARARSKPARPESARDR